MMRVSRTVQVSKVILVHRNQLDEKRSKAMARLLPKSSSKLPSSSSSDAKSASVGEEVNLSSSPFEKQCGIEVLRSSRGPTTARRPPRLSFTRFQSAELTLNATTRPGGERSFIAKLNL